MFVASAAGCCVSVLFSCTLCQPNFLNWQRNEPPFGFEVHGTNGQICSVSCILAQSGQSQQAGEYHYEKIPGLLSADTIEQVNVSIHYALRFLFFCVRPLGKGVTSRY